MQVTLTELRTRIRELTNTDTSSPTNHHINNPFLNRVINRWRKRWYDMLILACPEDFDTQADITTEANRSIYGISNGFPADYYRMIGVWATDGSNIWRPVPRFQHVEDLDWMFQYEETGNATFYHYAYRVRSGKLELELRPTPSESGKTVRLRYAPTVEELSADDDPIDGYNGWEDWIVYKGCVDVAIRRRRDPTLFLTQAATIEDQITQLAEDRDGAHPDRIQDTRRDLSPGYLAGDIPYLWGKQVP